MPGKTKDTPRTSRVRKNIPRRTNWKCTECDTVNAPSDTKCFTCSS